MKGKIDDVVLARACLALCVALLRCEGDTHLDIHLRLGLT